MGRSVVREDFYSLMLSDAGYACRYWWYDHDDKDLPLPDWDDLTTNDVARGWNRLLRVERDGRFFCCGQEGVVRRAEAELSRGEDADYDACVADAVIQLALFDKIIYG